VEKNYEEAYNWFRKAADQGHVGGQYMLAGCYIYGKGIERDEEMARKWLSMAAEQGNEVAREILDNLAVYFEGEPPKDSEEDDPDYGAEEPQSKSRTMKFNVRLARCTRGRRKGKLFLRQLDQELLRLEKKEDPPAPQNKAESSAPLLPPLPQ
jgi:TPR repeat protein